MLRVFDIRMTFSLSAYFFVTVCVAALLSDFGFSCKDETDRTRTSKKEINEKSALTSIERIYYDNLQPEQRILWLLKIMKKKNDLVNALQIDNKLLKANEIFSKFMCSINLLKQSIEFVICKVGPGREAVIPRFAIHNAQRLIKRLLPSADDNIFKDTYKLFENFFLSIKYSKSATAKRLRYALKNAGNKIWRCAAVAAATRKLCNNYMHFNASQAVVIYRAHLLTNDPRLFTEVLKEHNNWNLREDDIHLLNILFHFIDQHPINYEKFTSIDGKEFVLPLQDPDTTSTACL